MNKLSEHFTLEEMLASQTATRLGYDEQFSPPDSIKENLKALCDNVLEPLRAKLTEHFGVDTPIHVSSGYRCERDNAAIGGVSTSQHCKGQAADITCHKISVEELFQFIKDSEIVFDQNISEFGKWNHISFTSVGINRNERLKAIKVDGETRYIPD